jgi:hypothetical protein
MANAANRSFWDDRHLLGDDAHRPRPKEEVPCGDNN